MTEALYQPHILLHARRPTHVGVVLAPTHQATAVNAACGDQCAVSFRVNEGVVAEARFTGSGCALATAATSLLFEVAEGETLTALAAMTDDAFLRVLGVPVTTGRIDCALLGMRALRTALWPHS